MAAPPAPVGRPWAVELLAPKKAPVPWNLSLQAAVAVGGGFGIAVLSGHTVDGLLAGLGALPVAAADREGPWRLRVRRGWAVAAATGIGLVVGAAVRGHGPWLVVVGTLVAVVSGLVSSFDAVWSLFGLNLLLYTAIAGIDPLPGPAWRTALIAMAGAGFKLVVALPDRLRRRPGFERRSVAAVYDAIAELLVAADRPDRAERRLALTAALNAADDAMVVLRTSLGGPVREATDLVTSLDAALPLARAAVDRMTGGQPPSAATVAAVRALGTAVRLGSAVDAPPPVEADLAPPWKTARRAVDAEVPGTRRTDATRSALAEVRRLWVDRLTRATSRRALVATSRLACCFGVAEAVAVWGPDARPYWVPLTVAVALKPDFGSVFARAVQRALGTSVGVVVGAAILVLVSRPHELLPFFVVLAALLPITIVRNYGMFVTCLTPLVLIQIDSITPSAGQIVSARLLNTLIGVGIVLVIGFAAWPSTWRPTLAGDLLAALSAVAAGVRAAAGDPGDGRARRNAYRRLSDLRTTWSQLFADPSPSGRQARLLWPAVISLERMVDQAAHVVPAHRPPDPELAAGLVTVADALEHLAEGARRPDPLDERIAPLWDAVDEVAATLERVAAEPMRPAQRLAGLLHLR